MNRSSIGNGLWWLARRRMSAKRLADNQIAIQRQIAQLTPASSISVIAGNLCLGAAVVLLALMAPSIPKLFIVADTSIKSPSTDLRASSTKLIQLDYIKLQAKPRRTTLKPRSPLPSQISEHHSHELTPAKTQSHPKTPISRTPHTKLSALLHQFNHAKKAQADGYLQEAKALFLAIARSGKNPALGQESYLRALEISRQESDSEAHNELLREALEQWPNLKLQDWH